MKKAVILGAFLLLDAAFFVPRVEAANSLFFFLNSGFDTPAGGWNQNSSQFELDFTAVSTIPTGTTLYITSIPKLTSFTGGVRSMQCILNDLSINTSVGNLYSDLIQNSDGVFRIATGTLLTPTGVTITKGDSMHLFCDGTGATFAVFSGDRVTPYMIIQDTLPQDSGRNAFDSGSGAALPVLSASSSIDVSHFQTLGLSTSTVASFCDANMPFDDSSIIKATMTFVPNGLCRVGSFLVIPDVSAINQFSGVPDLARERIPFSYVSGVANTWSSLTASSSANAPTYVLNFHDLGLGSTTAIGDFIPNVTVFSSSTVEHFFPTGTFEALKTLAGIAIVLGLFLDIFFTARNMIRT
jgi:hypothetical protein